MTDHHDQGCVWTDYLDPGPDQLAELRAMGIDDAAIERVLKVPVHDDEPRPRLRSERDYVWGVFIVPIFINDEDRLVLQELQVIANTTRLVTVRKTPPDGEPYDISLFAASFGALRDRSTGMAMFELVDDIAEHFLDMVDGVSDEIDDLEDAVEDLKSDEVRRRISSLRHDLLHIRKTLAPTRDALRSIVDNRVEVVDGELFPHEVELRIGDAYDKMLRATEGLDLARDLVAGVRDYHQSKVANDQNEVMKRLTVVASLLLVPTLIAGIYGQNFEHMPELHLRYGYGLSWGLIILTTAGQLAFYRWKRWI